MPELITGKKTVESLHIIYKCLIINLFILFCLLLYDPADTKALVDKIGAFVRTANNDSLAFLEELITTIRKTGDYNSSGFILQISDLVRRERKSLRLLLKSGRTLYREIESFVLPALGLETDATGRLHVNRVLHKLARHAQAAFIALSLSTLTGCWLWGWGVSEYAPPPLVDTDKDGLFDKYETTIFLTDPAKTDTDDDGIPDGDEDHDNDGITNKQYQDENLSPYSY